MEVSTSLGGPTGVTETQHACSEATKMAPSRYRDSSSAFLKWGRSFEAQQDQESWGFEAFLVAESDMH